MGADDVMFDVQHVPFMLYPLNWSDPDKEGETKDDQGSSTLVGNLPSPETLTETGDFPPVPPHIEPSSKGIWGRLLRTGKKIPACVWVVNRHTEDITVVVSKYRPSRLLTQAGLEVSATGVGFNLSSATIQGPATRKTVPPEERDPKGAIAVFPMWTRKDGFGVITIFKGSAETPYIENDRIPLGATAYFVNRPNLDVVEYEAGEDLH